LPKVLINTVGTSILGNFLLSDEIKTLLNSASSSGKDKKILFNRAKKFVDNKIRDSKKNIGAVSAEINCLNKIGVHSGDYLYFLVSETIDGELCGNLVKNFCHEYFQTECFIKIIPGLQVHDARLFEREGLNNFVEEVIRIYDRYRGYEVILNTTGGFKAVVPYTTLLGLVFGLSTYYIFERSNQLIKLPAAPIDFDLDILKSLEPVIGEIKGDYMELPLFLKKTGLQYDNLDKLSGAIVLEDGFVTLSPLGRLIYMRYLFKKGYRVELSRQVHKKLQSGRYDASTFRTIFSKMEDPVHLKSKLHNEIQGKNVDCDCYKGGDTGERIFYYIDGQIVKICDIFYHDEYMRILNQGSVLKKDYDF